MTSKLTQLRAMTSVVADTGDVSAIKAHKPDDATTNPSLLLKAAEMPDYHDLLVASLHDSENAAEACDRFSVKIGAEISQSIKGYVSTEVDARLSFDTGRTVDKARYLLDLYEKAGVDRSRILIKIASTWEGIKAAEQLEKEGIHCNLTLLFSFCQAVACADAGAFLISPFVGRIYDWYKKRDGVEGYPPLEDPGVQSVTRIYNHYKKHQYATIVMGASFRNTAQIEALAGCDKLTISPDLLEQLDNSDGELPRILEYHGDIAKKPEPIGENAFRWELNEDAMATEKLAEGIRKFAEDQVKLEQLMERLKTKL